MLNKEKARVEGEITSQKIFLENKYLIRKGNYSEFVLLNEKELSKLANLQQEMLFIEELLKD